MKRGDIHYVPGPGRLGTADVKGDRPAVIVSSDEVLANCNKVAVVYLTTHPWSNHPAHVTLEATGRTSIALCEYIESIYQDEIGDYCGSCSEEEMRAIDEALLLSLGLDAVLGEEEEAETNPLPLPEQFAKVAVDYLRVQGERDAYKAMVDKLLEGR